LCWHSITKILRNGPRAHFPFTTSANVISTGELLKKTTSENHVSTRGFLRSPPVLMLFPLADC
jgi:hypothetical protein